MYPGSLLGVVLVGVQIAVLWLSYFCFAFSCLACISLLREMLLFEKFEVVHIEGRQVGLSCGKIVWYGRYTTKHGKGHSERRTAGRIDFENINEAT